MEQQPTASQSSEPADSAPSAAAPAASGTPSEAAGSASPTGASASGVPAGEPIAAGSTPSSTAQTQAAAKAAQETSLVSIDQFGAIDLRVAVVQGYERVPGTDRLLTLDIDLGSERRTIVSGIAHLIDLDTLVGRRIVVVANLQPARIRGVESRGMLLAAGGRGPGEPFDLVTVPDTIPPGTRGS